MENTDARNFSTRSLIPPPEAGNLKENYGTAGRRSGVCSFGLRTYSGAGTAKNGTACCPTECETVVVYIKLRSYCIHRKFMFFQSMFSIRCFCGNIKVKLHVSGKLRNWSIRRFRKSAAESSFRPERWLIVWPISSPDRFKAVGKQLLTPFTV